MNSFLKNTLKLTSGSLIAQIMGVILVPIITRLYSPDDLGALQLITSIVSILAIIALLSYHLAIMLPKEDSDAVNIFILCLISLTTTCVITGIICIIFGNQLVKFFNFTSISDYLYFIPIIIFFKGLFLLLNYWASRMKKFGKIASSRVINTSTSRAVQIISGYISPSPFGLILGLAFGFFVSSMMLILGLKENLNLLKYSSKKSILGLAQRYKKFPMFSTLSTIANDISVQIPVFLLAMYFNSSVVGHYSLSIMVIGMPMTLIGSSIAQVFFQQVSHEKNTKGTVCETVELVHKRLVALIIFPMLVLLFFSEELFNFIFGVGWETAAIYVKLLIPWTIMLFTSSPLTTLFNVLENQETKFSFDVSLLISRILVLFIGGLLGNPYLAVFLYAIVGSVFCAFMNILLLKKSGISVKKEIIYFGKILIIAVPSTLLLSITKLISHSIYEIIFGLVISSLFYYLIVIYNDNELKNIFTKYIIRGRT
ncbi:oligosaccharide flippase family protein [Methanosarcina sp. KYL-1]|uniref:lipopolysaccharide biosynthesis protein n=1 Tax=Methanosarcina sp. KYL-1 TaxID=2602068 RepID=UPI0021016DFA|nr:oligosaccharide flippase family protein [Methanosarcina sp. KYL-1]MCQ1535185.1 oligosaccharide flippase family protein [Methanosarcina sp. KYL-1]